jgi:auxin efflux carrier family protein
VFAAGIFKSNAALASKAIAYISLYLLGWSPCFWIFGPSILEDKEKTPATVTDADKAAKRKLLMKRVLSPPVLASLTGMALAAIPLFRSLIGSDSGLLNPLYEATDTIGRAYLPAVLLVLAGSLANTSKAVTPAVSPKSVAPEEISFTASLVQKAKDNQAFATQIMAIYLAKFFVVPTIMFAAMKYLKANFPIVNGWLTNDPMLYFVLLLETCMPSAQNLTVILQLQNKNDASARLAKTLLFVYVLGVPALCYWIIRILELTKVFSI